MPLKNDELQSVISDPQWLPSRWDRAAAAFDFVLVPREGHGDLTFLSDEYLGPAQLRTTRASISDLLRAELPEQPAAHYLFHSAFCCSTLVARALDLPGAVMALKEPQILNDIADAARDQALSHEVFDLAMRLISRPFAAGERLVIKPTNAVNVLGPALMNANGRSRAIFLYAPLRRFLGSVAAKGLWGRRWARQLFIQLLGETGLRFGFGDAEQFELSDLQIAALAWLMHHAQGANLLGQFPGRVKTLESETFLARRVQALEALAAHFEFQLSGRQAEQIASGPVFATHSKELGRKFDPEESLAARESIAIVDEEIEMIATWARHVADHVGVPIDFPKDAALLGS